MDKNIIIPEKELEELVNFHASKLVGKVCKRFEISTDQLTIKKEVKELVYESFRDLKDVLLVFERAREVFIFDLKKKEQ